MATRTGQSGKTPLQLLVNQLDTSSALLSHYLTTLTHPPTTTSPCPTTPSPPNPLHVLKDASILLKSHTTRLSLLVLNTPFTPSAVGGVLRDVTGTCLPALMSAVEIADADVWGSLLRGEIVSRMIRVVREVGVCLVEVRAVAQSSDGEITKSKGDQGGTRNTLVSTGVVWAACDALVELEGLDVGGVALKKAQEYHAIVKDALQELKEWREESVAPVDDDGDDSDEDEDELDMFGSPNRIPKDRPELLLALDQALGKVKRIEILYTAVIKRRIKTFTKVHARERSLTHAMDDLVDALKKIPETIDELASGFYDLDEETVAVQQQKLVHKAMSVIELVKLDWVAHEDEFTAWSKKWIEVMQ